MAHLKTPYVIVVGIDYSEISHLAFEAALRAASLEVPSELHVIHVASLLVKHRPARAPRLNSDAEALALALERLKRFIAGVQASLGGAQSATSGTGLRKLIFHIRSQAPGAEIAQLAADLDADLVVVGKQGNDGAAHLLLGSVAHQVVVLAPCPVLVVRAKKVASMVPIIDRPCPDCARARKRSGRRELWCEKHGARHGQRRTYELAAAESQAAEHRLQRRALDRWENEGGAALPRSKPPRTLPASRKEVAVRKRAKK